METDCSSTGDPTPPSPTVTSGCAWSRLKGAAQRSSRSTRSKAAPLKGPTSGCPSARAPTRPWPLASPMSFCATTWWIATICRVMPRGLRSSRAGPWRNILPARPRSCADWKRRPSSISPGCMAPRAHRLSGLTMVFSDMGGAEWPFEPSPACRRSPVTGATPAPGLCSAPASHTRRGPISNSSGWTSSPKAPEPST